MQTGIPQLDQETYSSVKTLKDSAKVTRALQIAFDEAELGMKEQVELCGIPAPTFQEALRAEEIARRMKAYGLSDVTTDDIGNVIGFRPGNGNGPVLAIGAHMDTVFPATTDVTVRQEGNRYFAPGIGDNCSGLRALLQIIRSLNEADIHTEGDIYFVATVGEEGLGDIRGSKYFVATHKIDGFIAIDNTEIGRILKGAVGSHRYRITIEGPGGHSYANFGEVASAIHAMCIAGNMIAHIKTPTNPKTTFTIGTIEGGTSVNSIAPSCSVEIDMRSVNNEALLQVESEILACFDKAVAEENALWSITDPAKQVHWKKENIGNRPAGMRPDDCPVLQVARSSLKALGQELTNYGVSSTDANAPVSMGIPATCLSSGGIQHKCHTIHEYFDKVDIHLGPQLLILTALGLVGCEGFKPLLPKRE